MRALVLIGLVVAFAPPAQAADFVPSGTKALPLLLGNDAYDDVDRSEVARTVEKQGYWAGAPIGVSQCASCHPDAAAQWASSAHRFASFNNPYYSAAVELFRKERGAVASRFCAGCHDPAMVASGRIDAATTTARARRKPASSVSPATRSPIIRRVTANGEAHVVIARSLAREKRPGHKALQVPVFTALDRRQTSCGSCHRVGLEEKVTGGRWLRGQDDSIRLA